MIKRTVLALLLLSLPADAISRRAFFEQWLASQPLWTPSNDLENVVVWFDAQDADSLTFLPSTSFVTAWADKSGHNRNADVITSYYPGYNATALNGKPTLRFNGSNADLATAAFTDTNGTAFAVVDGDYTTTFPDYDGIVGGVSDYVGLVGRGGTALIYTGTPYATNLVTDGSFNFDLTGTIGDPHMLCGFDITPAVMTTGVRIGMDRINAVRRWDGSIGEIILYRTALSTSDRQRVEGYLAWRWGLVGNLPPSHPYRNRPPRQPMTWPPKEAGWLAGYAQRIPIVLDKDKAAYTLNDMPVRIRLSSSSGQTSADVTAVFDSVGSLSNRISITTGNGTTELPVEVESWSNADQVAELWAKVPVVYGSADTVLYLYFDPTADANTLVGAPGSAAASNVWADAFSSVWHLSEDGTGNRLPSAGPEYLAPINYTGTEAQACQIDGGDVLTNNSAYLRRDWADAYGSDSSGSVSFWFTATNDATLFASADTGTSTKYVMCQIISGQIRILQRNTDTPDIVWTTNDAFADGLPHHVVYRSDGSAYSFYVDSVLQPLTVTSGANSGDWFADTTGRDNVSAGGVKYLGYDSGTSFGYVDEIRVYSTELTAAEVAFNYAADQDDAATFGAVQGATWLAGYGKRIAITVDKDKVDETLQDVPFRVNISDASGTTAADVSDVFTLGTNWQQVAFTAGNGVTELAWEMEKWDNANTNADLWVRLPWLFPDVDTVFYLYYDTNATATTMGGVPGSAAATNTWGTKFPGVWHFSETGTTADRQDSSFSGYDMTPTNVGGSVDAAGVIGNAIWLDGLNDYLFRDVSAAYIGQSSGSVSWWFLSDEGQSGYTMASAKNDTTSYYQTFGNVDGESPLLQQRNNDTVSTLYTSGSFATGVWHYATAWSDGTVYKIYVDGANRSLVVSGANNGDWWADTPNRNNLTLGAMRYGGTVITYWLGTLDEVRVCTQAVTVAEHKLNYYADQDAAAEFGTVETEP